MPAVAQQQPPRIAFVVGNAEYGQAPLPTALNDAGLVSEALRTVGFEVIEGANLNQIDFATSFRDFLGKAEAAGPDAVLFVYLSGYGFAFDGENYFAAIDAKLDRDSDIPLSTMRLSDLTRSLDGMPARTKVVAIDAARRLPFPLAAGGLPPGLIAVEALQNMLIGFSAAPGQLVADTTGAYGPYATAIAEMVRAAGVDITGAFTRIRARTHQLTEGKQTPWEVSALSDNVILVPAEAAAVAPAPAMPAATHARRPFREIGPEEAYAVAIERDELPVYTQFVEAYPDHPYAPRIWAIIRARREALAWRRAVRINTPESYWTYLQRYPNGIYAADADRRLRHLSASFQPPPDFIPVEFADVPPPLPDEPVAIVDFLPPAPPPPIILIEPRPIYFVDLPPPPPPPPLWRGGLPAVTVLPVIPRVAPGIRVPVAVQPGPGGRDRMLPPQGAIGVPPGQPPAGRPGGFPFGAGRPPGGPPAPGSAPTTNRPGAPAVVTAPPSQPVPPGGQNRRPPGPGVAPLGQPGPAAAPPGQPGPAAAPPGGPGAPGAAPPGAPGAPGVATAPAAGSPAGQPPNGNAPQQGRRQGARTTPQGTLPGQGFPPSGSPPGQAVPPSGSPPGQAVAPPSGSPPGQAAPPVRPQRPAGDVGRRRPPSGPPGQTPPPGPPAVSPNPAPPPAADRPLRPSAVAKPAPVSAPPPAAARRAAPPVAARPPAPPPQAAARRAPPPPPPPAAVRPAAPPPAAADRAPRPAPQAAAGPPPGAGRAAPGPKGAAGKKCVVVNGAQVCR